YFSSVPAYITYFFLESIGSHRYLHSFPTRRSSDLADRVELFVLDAAHQLGSHALAVVELGAVAHPLPDLRAGDLRGGRVLHQVVDRGRPVAAQPRGDVLDAHVHVVA